MVDHCAFDAFASRVPTASSAADSGAALGVVIGLLVVVLVTVGLYVLVSIALGKVFRGLGEQAWKAWIPVVNVMTLLELGGYSGLWAFAAFVPGLNIVAAVFEVLAINNVNRRLGKGGGFTLLAVLLYPVWACALGFGESGPSASETTGLPAVLAPTVSLPGGPQQAVYSPQQSAFPVQQSAFAAQAPSRALSSDRLTAAGASAGASAGLPQHSVFAPAPPVPTAPPAPFAETHGAPLAPPAPFQQAAAPESPVLPTAPPTAPPTALPAAHRLPNPPAPFWEPVRPVPAPHPPVDGPAPHQPVADSELPQPAANSNPPQPGVGSAQLVPVAPVHAPAPGPIRAALVSDQNPQAIPTAAAPATATLNPWAPPPAALLANTAHVPQVPPVAPATPVPAPQDLAVTRAPQPALVPSVAPTEAPLSRADLIGLESHEGLSDTHADDTGGYHDGVASAVDVDDMEATRISARRAKPWTFETDTGVQVSLTSPVVFLGRNPSGSSEYPDAQLVAVVDTGKTVSKSHARIELSNGVWTITDLHSTNGIVLIDGEGDERELVAGASALLTERFLLGELAARIFLES